MGTNEKLTVDDIIQEFSKENEVTEEFMERWEKNQYEESHLQDKVIDMMLEDIIPKNFMCSKELEDKLFGEKFYEEVKEQQKEYYFKKARGE